MDRHSYATPLPLHDGRANELGSCGPSRPFAGTPLLQVRAGRLLVPEGRPSPALHVVVSGAVGLWVTGHDGRRTLIALLGPDDVMGEEVLGADRPPRIRPETRSLSVSTLLVVAPHEVHRTMRRDPSFAGWLALALSRKIELLHGRLAATLALGVRERTLALLQALALRWGKPSPRGTVVDVPLSQETVAAMVGTTRESVNRALRDLRASGEVLRSGRRYVIPDPSTGVNRSLEGDSRATTPSPSSLSKCASTDRAAAGYSSAG
jgi:CRP/FNR family cyclic AMP-dependent transcriptional regulator